MNVIRGIRATCVTQAEIVASTLEEMGATVINVSVTTPMGVVVWVRHEHCTKEYVDVAWARAVLIEINKRLKFNGEHQLDSLTL